MTLLAKGRANTTAAAAASGRLQRVLYAVQLDPSRKFGSMEEQIFLTASAFQERGGLFLPVFLAQPEPIGLSHYRDAGLECAVLDLSRFRSGALVRLLRLAARHRMDVIHWNFFPPLHNSYVWALSVLAPRLKHYLTDHNSRLADGPVKPPSLHRLKRALLRRYARVVGVSQFVVQRLNEQHVWPAPISQVHFINTDRFSPCSEVRAAVRRQLGAADRFVLLTTAYLIKEKGIEVAVRALARLPESFVLWVVGDGPEFDALQALSGELGVQDRVHFLGLQSQVEPYMQAADAFVCPSLWAEAAGLVNIEAQACGLPVLASRIGGIPEYVKDGETGLLFPPGDADALARSALALQDPGRRRDMGRRARERAVQEFSVARRIDEYLDLYWTPTQEPKQ